jgi:predicted DNA-binding transcriptional regulator AlpA
MNTQPIESLWTAQQVAAFLQLSVSWVRHATAANELPHLRIGHTVRYEPATIRSWVQQQQAQPARVVSTRTSNREDTHG